MQTSFLKITAATAALCFSTFVLAQQTYSVSGTIKDKKNGELLIGI